MIGERPVIRTDRIWGIIASMAFVMLALILIRSW